MTLSSYLQVFLAGTAGGCLLELLHWYSLHKDPVIPAYAKAAKYWIVSGLSAPIQY